jgi:uncharacterized Ntn-hydrolase superfamily protein
MIRAIPLALFLVTYLALPLPVVSPIPTVHADELFHTFSIVARDSLTGDLGVAVQSHWFSVGHAVPWAEPGVGAVATQSLTEVSYGPKGLELMRGGMSAPEALAKLLAEDPQREVRQVAMIDAAGRVAVHTGNLCIAEAGHETGSQFSVQANLMLKKTVWPAMARAWRGTTGDLASRMMAALDAAQAESGDIRGQQSAAILIVKGQRTDQPWAARVMDLRVEDHPRPLAELARLVQLHRAYQKANEGDEHLSTRNFDRALAAYHEASELAPGNLELQFWRAASLFKAGRDLEALPLFRNVFDMEPNWALVVPRLRGLDVLAEGDAAFDLAVESVLSVAPEPARTNAMKEWQARRR